MSKIDFSDELKNQIVTRLQGYFEQELDVELGQFDAEFLLDFINKELGAHYYNQGLYDAQAQLMAKMDDVTEAITELEQDTSIR